MTPHTWMLCLYVDTLGKIGCIKKH